MPFTPKDWFNSPTGTTPLSAAAMEDLETRVTDYANVRAADFNVKDYGAAGDGAADDSAEIQAALDAGESAVVLFPPGEYIVSSPLTVGAGTTLLGSGRGTTGGAKITTSSTTNDMFQVSGDGVHISDMWLNRPFPSTPTNGAAIKLIDGTHAHIERVRIQNFYYGVNSVDAYVWWIVDCHIVNQYQYGIWVRNTASVDQGDDIVHGCTFENSVSGISAVRFESGGGLRLTNNKILTHDYGLDLQLADGATTVDLLIESNSIENQEVSAVRLGRQGAGLFSNVVIVGNQIANPSSSGSLVASGAGIGRLTIQGNVLAGTGTNTAVDLDGTTDSVVAGNTMTDFATGIKFDADAHRTAVGINQFLNVGAPLENLASYDTPVNYVTNKYKREVVALSSAVAYTNFYKLDLDQYRAGRIEVIFDLLLGSVGHAGRVIQKLLNRDGAAVVATAISDTASGAAIDVQFDVATTSGSVYIGLKRNAGAGGTDLAGTISLILDGHVQKVNFV